MGAQQHSLNPMYTKPPQRGDSVTLIGYPNDYPALLGQELAAIMKKHDGCTNREMIKALGTKHIYEPQMERWSDSTW